jgi:Ca2+:H+ antiporter
LVALVIGLLIGAGILHTSTGSPIFAFVAAGLAVAALARLLVRSVEALGDRFGLGAVSLLQSFLGNLPEIFIILFALHAGLYEIVKATIVGSILANILLVMGLSFYIGGRRYGRQKFDRDTGRQLGMLLTLSTFALAIPTMSSLMHTSAVEHGRELTIAISGLLVALFLISIPDTIRNSNHESPLAGTKEALDAASDSVEHGIWRIRTGVLMVVLATVGSGFAAYWFVSELPAAVSTMGISESFAGLVIVALASNSVESLFGIQLARTKQPSFALQVVLQSPVQVAMIVTPIIALAAPLIGAATFTLVLSPMLLAVLFMAVFIAVVVVFDGESTWFEGAALIALYVAIAIAFWWG